MSFFPNLVMFKKMNTEQLHFEIKRLASEANVLSLLTRFIEKHPKFSTQILQSFPFKEKLLQVIKIYGLRENEGFFHIQNSVNGGFFMSSSQTPQSISLLILQNNERIEQYTQFRGNVEVRDDKIHMSDEEITWILNDKFQVESWEKI